MPGDSYSRAIFLLLHILGDQRERIDIVMWNGNVKMEVEGGKIIYQGTWRYMQIQSRKKERKYDGSNKNIYLYETSINHNYDK